jgi:DNA-binding MarR family transcriptional regulator
MENNGDSTPQDSPLNSNEKPANEIDISPLQYRILELAGQLMERHYLLDLDRLFQECLRFLRDVGKQELQSALSDLVRRKILINGRALNRQQLLENPNRDRILAIIRQEPGIHFSRIKADINKESRTVQWHLKMLEKFDFIREERFGNNVVYFDFLQDKLHDRLHYYLHKDGAPAILKSILTHPGISMLDLIDLVQMPRSTVARKLKVLIDEGVVSASYTANQVMTLVIVDNIVPVLQGIFATGANP